MSARRSETRGTRFSLGRRKGPRVPAFGQGDLPASGAQFANGLDDVVEDDRLAGHGAFGGEPLELVPSGAADRIALAPADRRPVNQGYAYLLLDSLNRMAQAVHGTVRDARGPNSSKSQSV